MTTRSGSRIYRGQSPTASVEGACPHCHRIVDYRKSGRRRLHRDQDGMTCTGSGGLPIQDPTHLDEVPPVVLPAQTRGGSGKCEACGRWTKLRPDGTVRRHRAVADVFAGPHCPGGEPA